jgi:hypothetical protein
MNYYELEWNIGVEWEHRSGVGTPPHTSGEDFITSGSPLGVREIQEVGRVRVYCSLGMLHVGMVMMVERRGKKWKS